ncbi:MAG: hypothetical protein ACE145_06455 [Terriglobia bacterium]
MKHKRLTLLAVCLAAALAASSASAVEEPPLVVPPGTVVHVKLRTTITSKTNKVGDPFEGMVSEDVLSGTDVIVPQGSLVYGHVAYVKPSGRIKAKAEMRVVLDSILTPEEKRINLSSTLEDSKGGVCGNTGDEEGTIKGCGKSKKDAAKDAALGAGIGAGAGASVGMGSAIECRYYGNCGGPGILTGTMYGAGLGAGTALIYNLFKKQKEIILISGTELTFVVNRTVDSATGKALPEQPAGREASNSTPPAGAPPESASTTEKQ